MGAPSVAALFVQADGTYSRMPDVDCWPEVLDARTYAGPLPVVAHPPCASWGRYAKPTPDSSARGPLQGDDGRCFAYALASVRRCGGVLEHPAGSKAWAAYGLPGPLAPADAHGGWTLQVLQHWWGHDALKPTWLYVVGVGAVDLPACAVRGNVRPLEHLSKRQRERAPRPRSRAGWCASQRAAGRAGRDR